MVILLIESYCYRFEDKAAYHRHPTLTNSKFEMQITTILFEDDQVTVAVSEDALQISVHELEKVTSKYNMD